MEKLEQCAQCVGLTPSSATSCPHCGAAQRRARRMRMMVGTVAASMMLGCAYGMPHVECTLPDGGTTTVPEWEQCPSDGADGGTDAGQ